MKNILKSIFFLLTLLLTLLCVTACRGDGTDGSTSLEPKADFFRVTWNRIENATEHIVRINGKEHRTQETDFSLYEHISPGETKMVSVKAVVSGKSDEEQKWEMVEYTAEDVTEGLAYVRQSDDTYCVYCPSDAIPENGELVLPDTYEGEPVTLFRSEKLTFAIPVMAPKSMSDYNGPAFTGISKVRLSANLSKIGVGALYRASISELYLPHSVEMIDTCAFEGCEKLERITLSGSLKEIGHFAFSGCTALTEIAIPDRVKTIGIGAFARSGLTEITLPEGLLAIKAYTFYGCASLPDFGYSENLNGIGTEAFHHTLWYNNQPDGFLVHRHYLCGYKGEMPANASLTIPAEVRVIAGEAMFRDETNLVAISIPEGVIEIPDETFYGCVNLKQVTLPEGLSSIGDRAFYGCGMEQITLPESLKHIGIMGLKGVFENCTSLVAVTIPSNVEKMNPRCFYGCTSLASVTIREGVEHLGEHMLSGCTSLMELVLPASVKTCYLTTVSNTGVTSLVWPREPSWDGFYALASGEGIPITSLVIQKGTTELDYYFFYRCDGLKSFYFMGTEQEWGEVKINRGPMAKFGYQPAVEAEARAILDAWESRLTVYFYSADPPTTEGNYWHYVDGVPTAW